MKEAETRAEHIDPALIAAGGGVVEGSRIMREYFRDIAIFRDFMLSHYISVGMEEMEQGKPNSASQTTGGQSP